MVQYSLLPRLFEAPHDVGIVIPGTDMRYRYSLRQHISWPHCVLFLPRPYPDARQAVHEDISVRIVALPSCRIAMLSSSSMTLLGLSEPCYFAPPNTSCQKATVLAVTSAPPDPKMSLHSGDSERPGVLVKVDDVFLRLGELCPGELDL